MVTFARKRKLKISTSQNKIKFGVSKETTKGKLPLPTYSPKMGPTQKLLSPFFAIIIFFNVSVRR